MKTRIRVGEHAEMLEEVGTSLVFIPVTMSVVDLACPISGDWMPQRHPHGSRWGHFDAEDGRSVGRWKVGPTIKQGAPPLSTGPQYSKVRSEDSATRASYCVDMYTISTYAVSVEIRHRPLLW